ncbi:MAG TPA: SOS response-associated peptidase [Candidatus Nesterenkonia stercoripullorum]|uniref:Abasic site processing protein n=1 Tax=Candidatus Nesterenkonia stercoripullorum TaxID=2838701 RepID=A0A9D1US52_9MICC|nr:SOS response-associated peptidase [Candidatus Nesterenkonia stercoripullorum]
MCGRYVMALRAGDLADALDADILDGLELRESWNIAPTTPVPILVDRGSDRRELHVARWGLLPGWAKDRTFSSRTFNARSETVLSKPAFRSAVRRRRCGVPAQGYYEWRTTTDPDTGKATKRPHFVQPADGSLILFAGLYEWWQDPALVATGDEAPWVLSTTILTGPSPESSPQLAQLHDRMPLAMAEETATQWMSPGELPRDETEALVDRVRAEAETVAGRWTITEVGSAVGNVRNDSPELTAPVEKLF